MFWAKHKKTEPDICASEVAVRRLVKVLGIEDANIENLTRHLNYTRNLDVSEHRFIDRVIWLANNRSFVSMVTEEKLGTILETLEHGGK